MRGLKINVEYDETKKSATSPTPAPRSRAYTKMRARRARALPDQGDAPVEPPDTMFNRLDWVQVWQPAEPGEGPPAAVPPRDGGDGGDDEPVQAGGRPPRGNRIDLATENVDSLRVYLNDQMVNFAEPVHDLREQEAAVRGDGEAERGGDAKGPGLPRPRLAILHRRGGHRRLRPPDAGNRDTVNDQTDNAPPDPSGHAQALRPTQSLRMRYVPGCEIFPLRVRFYVVVRVVSATEARGAPHQQRGPLGTSTAAATRVYSTRSRATRRVSGIPARGRRRRHRLVQSKNSVRMLRHPLPRRHPDGHLAEREPEAAGVGDCRRPPSPRRPGLPVTRIW